MGKWSIGELDKAKTEQSIANEEARIDLCHEEVERLIRECEQLRTSYETKYNSLCNRIDSIKKSIEHGEEFIEACEKHLKDFE